MRKTFIAGNWKMNGNKESITSLLKSVSEGVHNLDCEVAVCPSHTYVGLAVSLAGEKIGVGGQDLRVEESGAFTGDVSGPMLKDLGCKYVIVGHSERRTIHGESDEVVADKFVAAQKIGLTPILCVGETQEERDQGITDEVVARQLDAAISAAGIEAIGESVIAYEPVWAIGTGLTATPEDAQAAHKAIRDKLAGLNASVAEKVQILYGGSMKAANAAELLAQEDIDGGLVGGASLVAQDFVAICEAGSAQ
jgi:triosephosphate isomerase